MRTLKNLWLPVAASVALLAIPRQEAAAQCPAIGYSSGCSIVINIGTGGTANVTSTGVGPYDNIEDVLVGVNNNSGGSLTSITLTGNDIFGFDFDGLCTYVTCNYAAPTGYEGPGTSFTIVDPNTGTVNFTGGLADGGSAYFSLEGDPTTAGALVVTGTTSTPEPASMTLLATGLVGIFAVGRRRRQSRND